jgi:hypothetical protein
MNPEIPGKIHSPSVKAFFVYNVYEYPNQTGELKYLPGILRGRGNSLKLLKSRHETIFTVRSDCRI